MRSIAFFALSAFALSWCAACAAPASELPAELPAPSAPSEAHAWLQQLVGEWDVIAEAAMEPGGEPMRLEITERVRAIGDLWILAEGQANFDGTPFTSLLTLGYDLQQEAFVGTWVDTFQTHMWVYRGSLDAARRVLTLEAEGPAFEDPNRTAHYRDVLELLSPDHKQLNSSILGDDGQWVHYMRADYRRRK